MKLVRKFSRNLNLPNLVTTLRLTGTFYYIFLMLNWPAERSLIILLAFGIIIGDKLDGYLARCLKQGTLVGRILDGSTDTIFLASSYLLFFYHSIIPFWISILLMGGRLGIEVFFAIRGLVRRKIIYDPPVSWKIAVLSSYLFVLGVLLNLWPLLFLMITLFLAYYALIQYLFQFILKKKQF